MGSKYLEVFLDIQDKIIPITDQVFAEVRAGMSELEVADLYRSYLNQAGLTQDWYPILVCAGQWTGKSISRRVHLLNHDVIIRHSDILMLDCTPIENGIWGNWAKTFSVGNNSFYLDLCIDCENLSRELKNFAETHAKNIGDIIDHAISLIAKSDLINLDSELHLGHSIFQVPPDQKVENCPRESRIFISEEYRNQKLNGILSIEPQLGRVNPEDGVMYGAKQQSVVIYHA